MIPVSSGNDTISSIVNSVPDVVDKISGFIKKKKNTQEDDETLNIFE